MANDNGLEGFSARLNELCEEHKMPLRGRAELLRKKFAVSREAARKWLSGASYPTMAKRAEICQWGNCTDSWLMTGKGDKHPVSTDLTDYQRQVLDLMQTMTLARQQLAVRLVSAIGDPHEVDGDPLSTGSGRRPLSLHEPRKKAH